MRIAFNRILWYNSEQTVCIRGIRKGECVNKIQIREFADIHTHILPGVDDGAKEMDEARQLIKMAYEDGTRILIFTPHSRGSYKKNTPAYLQEVFEAFRRMIIEDFPDMNLYLGNEIYYQLEVPDRLAEGRILSMCHSQYVLLEFSGRSLRSQVIAGVSDTIRYGYTPIIAHAERYEAFRSNRTLVDEVLSMGALIQLNADSVMGRHGFQVKQYCHKLLKRRCVHFIASDAHDPFNRPPLLNECFLRVSKKYGEEYATEVFWGNARAMIENRTI